MKETYEARRERFVQMCLAESPMTSAQAGQVHALARQTGCELRQAAQVLFDAQECLKDYPQEAPAPQQVAQQWLQRKPCTTLEDFLQYHERGWKLMLDDGEAILPQHMQSRSQQRLAPDTILTTWQGHPKLGPDFTVTTRWQKTQDGRCVGRISYRNYHHDIPIATMDFPRVAVDFDVDAKVLEAAFDLGFYFNAAIYTPGNFDCEKGISSMQFGAIIRPHGQSFYLDFRDPQRYLKFMHMTLDKQRVMTVSGRYLRPLGDTVDTHGEIPYDSSVAFFDGDWYEAARIYRQWALQQPWVTNRKGKLNPLRDIDMWVWNRGLIKDVIPPIERLHQDCPKAKLALDWYWWHSNPYDTDYPFFWPPREGVEAFTKAVSRLNDMNVFSQVYINGVCWDMDAETWPQGGNEDVMFNKDGTPHAYAFNQYNHHRLAYMCGEAPKHHDQIAGLLKNLRSCGLSGQYLDMIGNATFSPCYNPNHSHPKGGGNYVIQGYRKMIQRLKDENPNFPLSTESAQEAYMDLFDSSIVCSVISGERMGLTRPNPVPLFTAVYHGSFALYGSYALPDAIPPWDPKWPDEDRWQEEKPWHRLYPDQFFLELARTIVFGVQPMVCSLREKVAVDPDFKDVYQFILDTAVFYHDHKDFLFAGEMLSPDGFRCEDKDVTFFQRMIFTKRDKATSCTKTFPCVLHSCWRSPDGREALILANYTADSQPWSFRGREGVLAPHAYACIDLQKVGGQVSAE